MPLSLNVQDGFNVDFYWTDVLYKSYVTNINNPTIEDDYLCYRFIASGGKPPYVYTLLGNTPSVIGLVNKSSTSYYGEYADLTLLSDITFSSSDANIYNVAVTCTDSEGQSLTVYGTVKINLTVNYGLSVDITGTLDFFKNVIYLENPITGLSTDKGHIIPRWYYKVTNKQNIELWFTVTGTPLSTKAKPRLTCKIPPTSINLNFEAGPDDTKWYWRLYGKVEAPTRDRFFATELILTDGPTANKLTYPSIDLNMVVIGVPSS